MWQSKKQKKPNALQTVFLVFVSLHCTDGRCLCLCKTNCINDCMSYAVLFERWIWRLLSVKLFCQATNRKCVPVWPVISFTEAWCAAKADVCKWPNIVSSLRKDQPTNVINLPWKLQNFKEKWRLAHSAIPYKHFFSFRERRITCHAALWDCIFCTCRLLALHTGVDLKKKQNRYSRCTESLYSWWQRALYLHGPLAWYQGFPINGEMSFL